MSTPEPDKTLVAAIRAHVGSVAVDLPSGLVVPEWDLEDTGSQTGIFDYSYKKSFFEKNAKTEAKEAEGRAASFLKGILRSSLELEAAIGDTPDKNSEAFLRFAELVKFIADICYVPKGETRKENMASKNEKKQDFSLNSFAVMYEPHNRETDGMKLSISQLEPAATADVVLEIGNKTGQTLLIGLFPNTYSFYGRQNQHLTGASIEEATENLSRRTKGSKTLTDQNLILDEAKATFRERSLNVLLFDKKGGLISGMHGYVESTPVTVTTDRGKNTGSLLGFDFTPFFGRVHSRSFPVRVFMPVGVEKPDSLSRLAQDLGGLDIQPVRSPKRPPA